MSKDAEWRDSLLYYYCIKFALSAYATLFSVGDSGAASPFRPTRPAPARRSRRSAPRLWPPAQRIVILGLKAALPACERASGALLLPAGSHRRTIVIVSMLAAEALLATQPGSFSPGSQERSPRHYLYNSRAIYRTERNSNAEISPPPLYIERLFSRIIERLKDCSRFSIVPGSPGCVFGRGNHARTHRHSSARPFCCQRASL